MNAALKLLHRYDRAKPSLATHHVLKGFVGLRKRELFNHAVHVLKPSKFHSILAVQGMP